MSSPTLFDIAPKTQTERLLKHFQSGGTITSLESYDKFKITQLARCIDDLERLGHEFRKDWEKTETGKYVKRYKLKG
jgi:hypothetical protein